MEIYRTLSLAITLTILPMIPIDATGQQQTAGPAKKASSTRNAAQKTAPEKKNYELASTATPDAKTDPAVAELIAQGKSYYRTSRFKQALAKFESALSLAPENDEALGLAAVTSFRLDNQVQSRDYFIRRANLPDQKDSVRAFSFYRVALTHWREVHDLISKFCDVKGNRIVVDIPEQKELDVKYGIENGLEYVEKTLALTSSYPEAYNVKNLLLTEAALAEKDDQKAGEYRKQAVECLRRAIELSQHSGEKKNGDTVDFRSPTIRIAELARKKEDEVVVEDPMMKLIEGGRPTKKVQAVFPSIRSPKSGSNQNDPSTKGVTSDGGAYSLGSGRGALTAAYMPGTVKIEVLVSQSGDVEFAHVIDGRSDLIGAAIIAARAWKFEPAKFEGYPVQISGIITFDLKPGRGR
jgi:tetratricopeptide (TPR) repeat protein